MKKLLSLFLIIISLLFYYLNKDIVNSRINGFIYQSPCDTPLSYRIDSIDPKFNINKDVFLNNIQDAGDIWSKAAGNKLFIYKPDGKLSINLIYDERQSLKG